jgi:hypothetical protein
MENLLKYLDEKVEEKRLLNEASEIELSKEVFELYSSVFENLSDAFYDMANKSNVDGNGKVTEDLRKAEVAIQKIKAKLKTISASKNKEKLDSTIKKAVGEIGNSLKILKDKVDRDLVPSFEIEPEPELNPDVEDEILGEK